MIGRQRFKDTTNDADDDDDTRDVEMRECERTREFVRVRSFSEILPIKANSYNSQEKKKEKREQHRYQK